jgi:thioredoxin 1
MESIQSLENLEAELAGEGALLVYFSSETCSVCKVLKPKVAEFVKENYPHLRTAYVDTQLSPLLAGQYRIFAIPTILLFFEGKEHVRFSRNISLHQLDHAISRPYSLIFGDEV